MLLLWQAAKPSPDPAPSPSPKGVGSCVAAFSAVLPTPIRGGAGGGVKGYINDNWDN